MAARAELRRPPVAGEPHGQARRGDRAPVAVGRKPARDATIPGAGQRPLAVGGDGLPGLGVELDDRQVAGRAEPGGFSDSRRAGLRRQKVEPERARPTRPPLNALIPAPAFRAKDCVTTPALRPARPPSVLPRHLTPPVARSKQLPVLPEWGLLGQCLRAWEGCFAASCAWGPPWWGEGGAGNTELTALKDLGARRLHGARCRGGCGGREHRRPGLSTALLGARTRGGADGDAALRDPEGGAGTRLRPGSGPHLALPMCPGRCKGSHPGAAWSQPPGSGGRAVPSAPAITGPSSLPGGPG